MVTVAAALLAAGFGCDSTRGKRHPVFGDGGPRSDTGPSSGPCLLELTCDDDSDCPSSARCDLGSIPPRCRLLACSDPGSTCSADAFCAIGSTCVGSVCTPTSVGDGYHAIIITDAWVDGSGCALEPGRGQGADIDAVALFDSLNQLVGYVDLVQGSVPTTSTCGSNSFANLNQIRGAPDASAYDGYVSLTGGKIAGEFAPNSPKLTAGDYVEIYEVDLSYCHSCVADTYALKLAKTVDCVFGGCDEHAIGTGSGTATFTLAGF